MFDNIMGWKAQSALGGALGGFSAMDEIQNSGQRRQMNNLDMLIKQLAYEEAQKDSPVKALTRELATNEGKDQLGAWQSGEMPQMRAAERQLGHQKTLTGIDSERINKLLKKSEFFVMADQYLESAKNQPHLLAGEGWQHIRETGKAIGVDVGETYTPEGHMKIKAAAQPAMQTIPQLQKLQLQQQDHANATRLLTTREAGDDRRLDTRLGHEAREGAANRAAGLQAARIAAEASIDKSSMGKDAALREAERVLASANSFEDAVEKLSYGQAVTLYSDMVKTLNPKVQSTVDVMFAQLRRGSKNPEEAAAAKAYIEGALAEAHGTKGEIVAAVISKSSRSPTSGPIKQGPATMEPGVEPKVAPRQVKTIEEARALPKGTKFIDPNGVERVR